ncbi:MAG: prenyltransferase/squalene oxidase repeat-containing protein [Candidatus Fervidibacter sp.]|uniref:prenyltransferase/squalene oxidase repeat-containing protein n=1 Tax=Candidatus Fervidibacter sp. TaxID=3100871 RepID=UPI004049757D
METFWHQLSNPYERLKWVRRIVSEKPRHPFTFLWQNESWAGVAARRNLIGLKLKRDEPLRLRLIKGILSEQYPKGGFRSSIGWTGLRLFQLAQLDLPANHLAIQKALDWLRRRQDYDGSLLELPRVPTAYPSIWGEELRFPPLAVGVTAFVLCGVLRWDRESKWIEKAVIWVARQIAESKSICCRSCAVHSLHALSISNYDSLVVMVAIDKILEWLAEHQSEQGEWFFSPEASFPVLFGLGSCPKPEAKRQIARALPVLVGSQYSDGGWGRTYRAEKTWLVTKALMFHELLESFVDLTEKCPWLVRPKEWLEQLPPLLDEPGALV